jgi:MoaA/NifB/PqqE/SkfB family radical SAM enzyme
MPRLAPFVRRFLYTLLAPRLRDFPRLWNLAAEINSWPGLIRHTAALYYPQLIKPEPSKLTVAITAYCNLRCVGCRYGRDFMPNSQLAWPVVRDLLDDAKEAGFLTVRLYGGEPLLHPDLPKMVEHGVKLGLRVYVTTNGILLKEKVDELYAAGLREITIGFYGVGSAYDSYVQGKDRYVHLEDGIAYVRQKYGQSMRLYLNWLLMRPSCSVEALHAAYQFAQKYTMTMGVDLIHYSLPYFTEGPDRMLQFLPEDRLAIEKVVAELIRLKHARPEMLDSPLLDLRAIPDWLIKGPIMRVPCDSYRLIWVGADGTVQMCYVTFKLGNLHEKRLREMLFAPEHRQAARDAFALNCPNCHCHRDSRIKKHLVSRIQYSRNKSL